VMQNDVLVEEAISSAIEPVSCHQTLWKKTIPVGGSGSMVEILISFTLAGAPLEEEAHFIL